MQTPEQTAKTLGTQRPTWNRHGNSVYTATITLAPSTVTRFTGSDILLNVSYETERERWNSYVAVNGRTVYQAEFVTREAAVRAAERAAARAIRLDSNP